MAGLRTDTKEATMGRTPVMRIMLLATLPLLACDGQGTAPSGKILLSTHRAHGLELSLSIDPAAAASGETFTATLTITNRRDRPARLISGCTQLARGVVYRAGDEEQQWFIGASGGCYTATSEYRLDVGESFEQVWNATAVSRVYLGDFEWETVPAPEGAYVFRVSPDVITIDGEGARLPELQAPFRVK
jgi:hypothetical protein